MRRILLAVLISLAGLLAVEGLVRILTSGSRAFDRPFFAGGNHARFLFVPDSTKHYALRPGFTGRDRCVDFDVPVTINSAGLRDRERPEPRGSALRVLGVGDSFTYGEGVRLEQTYLARLEARLEEGHRQADVIKAGVPGYGLSQMVTRALELLPVYGPDVLLVGLFHSALSREENPYLYKDGFIVRSSYAEHLDLVGGNLWYSPYPPGWRRSLQVHLLGYSRLARWLTVKLVGGGEIKAPEPIRRPDPEELRLRLDEVLAGPENRLAALQRECEAVHCRLIVLLIPEKREDWRRVPNTHDIAAALIAWGDAQGIRFLDLSEALGRFWNDRQADYFDHDAHWNAAGHARVAEYLAGVLEEQIGAEKSR